VDIKAAVHEIENVADWIIDNVVTNIINSLAINSSGISPEYW
jgi:hypothetical protein